MGIGFLLSTCTWSQDREAMHWLYKNLWKFGWEIGSRLCVSMIQGTIVLTSALNPNTKPSSLFLPVLHIVSMIKMSPAQVGFYNLWFIDGCLKQLLGAYFVVLPLRDEAALSLGTGVLPSLFLASLVLTMIAAPASSYLLSLPSLPKGKVKSLIL